MTFKKFIPFKTNSIYKTCLDKGFEIFCITVLTAANHLAVVIFLHCDLLAYQKSFNNRSLGVAEHIPPIQT